MFVVRVRLSLVLEMLRKNSNMQQMRSLKLITKHTHTHTQPEYAKFKPKRTN